MNKIEDTEVFTPCPLTDVQPIVRGKWTMVIMYFLTDIGHEFMPVLKELLVFSNKYQEHTDERNEVGK